MSTLGRVVPFCAEFINEINLEYKLFRREDICHKYWCTDFKCYTSKLKSGYVHTFTKTVIFVCIDTKIETQWLIYSKVAIIFNLISNYFDIQIMVFF